MMAVIFEVAPRDGKADRYFEIAAELKLPSPLAVAVAGVCDPRRNAFLLREAQR